MERYWVYAVPSPQAAADAVRFLDEFPTDKVAGLGVVSKPSEDGPDRLYLFVHGEQLLLSEADAIERILEHFGRWTDLTVDDLLSPPAPDFVTSGLGDIIVRVLTLQYPGQVSLR